MDFAGVDSNSRVAVFLNTGNFTFNTVSPIVLTSTINNFTNVAAGDVDNDGLSDVFVAGSTGTALYYNRNGSFVNQPTFPFWPLYADESIALADYNADGALDAAFAGGDLLGADYFRVFNGKQTNTAPVPPSPSVTLTYSGAAVNRSTFTVTWPPSQYDTGNSSNSLYYQVEVSTFPTALSGDALRITTGGRYQNPWNFGTPGLGGFVRPAVSTSWAGVTGSQMQGFMFSPSTATLAASTSFYFRVQTIDAGLKRSTWSAEYMCVIATYAPSGVTDLTATTNIGINGISLAWTAPGDHALSGNLTSGSQFKIEYSSVGIINTANFDSPPANLAATAIYISTVTTARSRQSWSVPNLQNNTVYWFAVKTENSAGLWSVWQSSADVATYNLQASTRCVAVNHAPNAPANLVQYDGSFVSLSSFTWTNSSTIISSFTLTDPDAGQQVKYCLQITTVSSAGLATWTSGYFWNYTSPLLNQGTTTYYWPTLTAGKFYWWRVWAIDAANATSSTSTALSSGGAAVLTYKTDFDPNGIRIVPGLGLYGNDVYSQLALGDFDNNGTLDLAVTGEDINSLFDFRVYSGNGDGTFNFLPALRNDGTYFASLAWGDYNNDGDLDIALSAGNIENTIGLYVYRNKGNGTFDTTPLQPAGAGVGIGGGLAWGDFNNDGFLDLAASGWINATTEKFYIYKNNCNGSFNTTPVQPDSAMLFGGYEGSPISCADFNNDGLLDISVCADYWQSRLYKNDGDGTFTITNVGVTDVPYGQAYAFGDYDNDGSLDIASPGGVYQNNGAGSFSMGPALPSNGDYYCPSSWADFNNDGKLDLVESGGFDYEYLIELTNNGSSGFSGTEIMPGFGLGDASLAVGDVDNDGDTDIIASGGNGAANLLLFKNKNSEMGNANIAPVPPSGLSYQSSYFISNSTVIITWPAAQYDTGMSSRTLSFQVVIASAPMMLASNQSLITSPGAFITTWAAEADGFGTFNRPVAKIWGSDISPKFGYQLNLTTASITGDTSYYYRVQTIDGDLKRSTWSAESKLYIPMGPAPAAITNLTALTGASGGEIKLSWTFPGADGTANNLVGGVFKIRYSSYTTGSAGFWTDAASNWVDQVNKYQVTIATNATLSKTQSATLVGLTPGVTYYARAWTRDEVGVDSTSWNGNWSALSNGATAWAMTATSPQVVSDLVATNNSAIGAVKLTWTAPGGNGQTGDLNAGSAFKIEYSTVNVITTNNFTAMQSTMAIQSITISTVTRAMTTQTYNVGGLTNNKQYWFAIETENSQGNWSTWYSSATGDTHTTYNILASTVCSFANHQPAISNLEQLNGSLVSMTSFTWTNSGTLMSSFTISDADYGQQVRFVVQITSATNNAGAANWATLFQTARSGLIPQGTTTYIWPALNPNAFYWWRAWAEDSYGLSSTTSTALVSGGSAVLAYKTPFNPAFIEPQPGWGIGWHGPAVSWGDFNGDGYQDLAIGGNDSNNQYMRVYMNNGAGGFNSYVEPQPGHGVRLGEMQWGDFNNDGKLDLAVTGYDGDPGLCRVYINAGNGTFSASYVDATSGWGRYYGNLAMGDYNNDGNLDLAVIGTADINPLRVFRIYRNKGDGTFDTNFVSPQSGWGISGDDSNSTDYTRVAWGDFENDGDLDIATCGIDTNNTQVMRVYKNNGDGSFNSTAALITNTVYDLAWGDYDNDGFLDVIAASATTICAFRNNGNGTLNATPVNILGNLNIANTRISLGDYDNDGNIDIAATGQDIASGQGMLRFYHSLGNGNFDQSPVNILPGWGMYQCGAMALADYDNDGGIDIAVAGQGSGTATDCYLRVFNDMQAQLGNANTAPTAPAISSMTFSYSAPQSTFTITWLPGQYDVSHSSNSVYYELAVSTFSTSLSADSKRLTTGGCYQSPWNFGTPNLGSFIRPAVSTNWAGVKGTQMVGYTITPSTNDYLLNATTFYFRVQTIDSGLTRSAWSSEYTCLASSYVALPGTPAGITDLTAANNSSISGISLVWTATGDSGQSGNLTSGSVFKVEYSTVGILTTGNFDSPPAGLAVTTVNISTTATAMSRQSYNLPGLLTNTTYWFAIKTENGEGQWSTWQSSSDAAAYNLRASTVCKYTNSAPLAPSGLVQYDGSMVSLSSFTWTNSSTIISSFTLTDPDAGQQVKYCLQITTVSSAGLATWTSGYFWNYTSPLLNQGTTTYYWPALTAGNYYWWRVWAIDAFGATSSTTTALMSGGAPVFAYKTHFDPVARNIINGLSVANAFAALGDFDGNGTLDLAITGNTGSGFVSRVYKNNGDGSFNQAPVSIPVIPLGSGLSDGAVAWGDFDNDGDLDIAINGTLNPGNRLFVFRGNGNGTFNPSPIYPNPGWGDTGMITWADFNNDGYLDLAASGYDGSAGHNYIFLNNRLGDFNHTPVEPDATWGPASFDNWVSAADFNNDGNLDLAVVGTDAGYNGHARIYKGNGNGTFNASYVSLDANNDQGYSSITFGDYNLDGNLDVEVGGNDLFAVNTNNGNGTFGTAVTPEGGAGGGQFGNNFGGVFAAWADINNDGKPDMVVSGYRETNSGMVRLELNNGNGTFTPTEIQPALQSFCQVALGDLDNDGDVDAVMLGSSPNYYLAAFFNKNSDMGNANTIPVPPAGLSYQSSYNITNSTVVVTWPAAQYDAGMSSRTLSFQVVIASVPMTLATDQTKIASPGAFLTTWVSQGDGFGAFNRPNFSYRLNLSTAGITADTSYYYRVQTIDGSLARSTWSAESKLYMPMGLAPAAITNLTALKGNSGGELKLSWTSPGADGTANNIYGGVFKIRYSTYTIASAGFWTDAATNWTDPVNKYQITIPTNSVPSVTQSATLVGLTPGGTYYICAWTRDEVGVDSTSWNGNWSALSNGATAWAMTATAPQVVSDLVAVNNAALGVINLTWTAPGGNGQTGDLNAGSAFKIEYSTVNVITTNNFTVMQSTMAIQSITISTVTTAMSRQSYNVGGLTSGKQYWFAIETENSQAAWSTWYSSATGDGHTTYNILASTICSYTNHAPTISSLEQLNGSMVSMSSFTWTNAATIISLFTIRDTDLGQQEKYHIQISTVISASGLATWTSGYFVNYTSTLITQGTTAYYWPVLTAGNFYWWRAWVEDQYGLSSATSTALVSGGAAVLAYKTVFNPIYTEPQPGYGYGVSFGSSLSMGDFDGDGYQDIAACGIRQDGYYTAVYLNNSFGDGTFSANYIEPQPGLGGVSNGDVAWGDFNNDGKLDLAVTGYNGDPGILRVYINAGNNSFSGYVEPTPGWGRYWSAVAWGDYNNDGNLDLAMYGGDDSSSADGICRIYRNKGDGSFDPNYYVPTAGWGMSYNNTNIGRIAWADYDNDGDLDIAFSGDDNSGVHAQRVYRNNGDGTFSAAPVFTLSWNADDIAWGDYNNDGFLDLMATSGNTVVVYPNNGNGTINSTPVTLVTNTLSACHLVLGDYDNDGNTDAGVIGQSNGAGVLKFYHNHGNGTFDATDVTPLPGWGIYGKGNIRLWGC